jgi:hypothetical protein
MYDHALLCKFSAYTYVFKGQNNGSALRPKIVINALPRPEVIHKRIPRNLLILIRKGVHQIMNLL